MNRSLARTIAVLSLGLASAGAPALAGERPPDPVPLHDWTVPRAGRSAVHTLADIGGPVFFVPITPCRLADTRVGSGLAGSYGPPAIAANTLRTMPVTGGVCTGFPGFGIAAASINFTVVNTQGPGDIRTFPAGGTVPLVSTLNYAAGQTIANATIVPVGTGSGISIQADVSGTDLVVDVNGYFIAGFINTGESIPIFGTVDASGVLFAINGSTSTDPHTSAIRGRIAGTQDGPSAVLGESTGASGANSGVKGVNSSGSYDSAGVWGVAAGGIVTNPGEFGAGVRGEGWARGVLGLSTSFAVVGKRLDAGGVMTTQGVLGTPMEGVNFSGGLGGTGTKSFYEPHPTDPSKMIRYVSMEGPEAGTYFRGRGRFVGGAATIVVPETFRFVTDPEGLTVQLTPIGRAVVDVSRIGLDAIEVESTRDVEFSYLVQGVRRAYKDFEVVSEGWAFKPESADARMPLSLSPVERQRLIDNGTYNADGTVNMQTAERVGWVREWRDLAEKTRPEVVKK